MTQSIAFIRCNNEECAKQIEKVLHHPLYIFINNICRFGNFNNIRILQNFPYCSQYDAVFTTFNITYEEKRIIEHGNAGPRLVSRPGRVRLHRTDVYTAYGCTT